MTTADHVPLKNNYRPNIYIYINLCVIVKVTMLKVLFCLMWINVNHEYIQYTR